MNLKEVVSRARRLSRPFRVVNGRRFRLKDVDPAGTLDFTAADKPRAVEELQQGVAVLAELQDRLYAQDSWAVLVIFQAMDAAGKDSAIKHVMSGVNPQGCQVFSFKAPSREELDHDYLWREMRCLPERGRIGIFNRSYYEEVLVVRVHQEFLKYQRLPAALAGKDIFRRRYEDISHFERYLAGNGIAICKIFLHVSKKEQKKRFLERIGEPDKHWKFSGADVREREHWREYMDAYEEAVRQTSAEHAPWYVVPADHKWFTRLIVASAVIDTLASLKLGYPTIDDARRKELAAAKRALLGER